MAIDYVLTDPPPPVACPGVITLHVSYDGDDEVLKRKALPE